MSLKALLTGGGDGLIASVRRYLDARHRLCVDAVIDTLVQQPVPVTFGPGGGVAPKMISLYFNQTTGALAAQSYRRVVTYNVPLGYYGFLIRFTSYQSEAANSRIVTVKPLGSLNIVSNAFTSVDVDDAYLFPQWTGNAQIDVTQDIGSASAVDVTIGYTNDSGISGRSCVVSIPKNTSVGTRFNLTLQAGDLGIQSVQSMSTSPTSSSGAIDLLGFIQLGYHEDAGTASYETLYAPGATAFQAGAIIGVEFQGGSVAKERRFDLLMQLSPELVIE